MTTEDMIRALGNVIEEYKNKPVFTGQTDIPMMCRDVINKLKELSNPWHTGTPTEIKGWFLLKYKWYDEIRYITMQDPVITFFVDNRTLGWQKLEEGEEVNG